MDSGIFRMMDMGFTRQSSKKALASCNGNVEQAIELLCSNPRKSKTKSRSKTQTNNVTSKTRKIKLKSSLKTSKRKDKENQKPQGTKSTANNDPDPKLEALTSDLLKLSLEKSSQHFGERDQKLLTREEYINGVRNGEISKYKGTKWSSGEEAYDKGFAFRVSTKRWVKAASRKKPLKASSSSKKEMAAFNSMLANIIQGDIKKLLKDVSRGSSESSDEHNNKELMKIQQALKKNKTELSKKEEELRRKTEDMQKIEHERKTLELEKKIFENQVMQEKSKTKHDLSKLKREYKQVKQKKKILEKQCDKLATEAIASKNLYRKKEEEIKKLETKRKNLAQKLVIVIDTNVLINDPGATSKIAHLILHHGLFKKAFVVIPRQVLRELDGLKTSKILRNGVNVGYRARMANSRINDSLRTSSEQVIGQREDQIYRDKSYHRDPRSLRGDDAILNCALYFQTVEKAKTAVVSCDINFLAKLRSNDFWVAKAGRAFHELECLIKKFSVAQGR